MKNKLENFLIELDNKLESAKDDRNTKIVNYIQLSQNAKEAFIMYLINDYQLNNRDYKKLNLRKYAYAPLAVAAGSIGALYTIQHGIYVFDLFGIMLETYFVGLVSTGFTSSNPALKPYFMDDALEAIITVGILIGPSLLRLDLKSINKTCQVSHL